jgi:hypothetical protein
LEEECRSHSSDDVCFAIINSSSVGTVQKGVRMPARYPQAVPRLACRIEKQEPLDNPRPNADGVFADGCISIVPRPGGDN